MALIKLVSATSGFFVSEKSARDCAAELAEHYGDCVDVIVEKKGVEV
jgi:hypothetical protein